MTTARTSYYTHVLACHDADQMERFHLPEYGTALLATTCQLMGMGMASFELQNAERQQAVQKGYLKVASANGGFGL